MLQDGLSLTDNSVASNFQIQHGAELPSDGLNVGELFFLTAGQIGLYVYSGASWSLTAVTDGSSLTGTTLASNVVTSSLTSVGILSSLAVSGNVTSAAPTLNTHLTTKLYVDQLIQGLSWKNAARAATTGNITLSGEQIVDGVSLVSGNRVLVKNQTTGSQNGVYFVSSGAWSRTLDFDGSPDAGEVNGAAIFVTDGSTNGDTSWTQTATIVTIGVEEMEFAQISAAGAGAGADAGTLTGTVLAANVVSSSLTSVGTITSGTWSGSFGAVSGANLTSLNASNLSTGTVATARLGTGTANSTTFLRGDQTWVTLDVFPKKLPRSSSYAGTTADTGYRVVITAGVTIPANVYADGDAFSLYNNSGTEVTITQGSGLTLRKDGSTDIGTRTLAAYGSCFIWFNSTTEAIINGSIS